MSTKYKRKTRISFTVFDQERVTKVLRDNAEEIRQQTPRCIFCGFNKYAPIHYVAGKHRKTQCHEYTPYTPDAEEIRSTPFTCCTHNTHTIKLRRALIDTLASLRGWMEIQDSEDAREYDSLAVAKAERILRETA